MTKQITLFYINKITPGIRTCPRVTFTEASLLEYLLTFKGKILTCIGLYL